MKKVLLQLSRIKRDINTLLLLLICITLNTGLFAQWTTIATDANNDSGGMEGTKLEYRHAQLTDSVFFRFTVTNLASYASGPAADLHFFLPNGLDNGGLPYTHWTSTTMVHKSFFIYADAGGSPPSSYTYSTFPNSIETGSTGVLKCSNCITIVADVPNNHLIYGVKRTDLISDSEMGGTTATISAVVANVGHDVAWDDNVTQTGTVTITVPSTPPVGVSSITVAGQGGATAISTPGGTLQMMESVLPANATDKTVSWSVSNSNATISATGLLTGFANGNVTVIATANDGSGVTGNTTIAISNQTTGITANNQGNDQLSVYPNPAMNEITVNMDGFQKEINLISIVDMAGKTVKNFTEFNESGEINLNISELNNGTYFMFIEAGDELISRQFQKASR